MVLLLSNSTSIHTLSHSLFFNSNHHRHGHHYFRPKLRLQYRRKKLSVCSIEKNGSSFYANIFSREQNQPRTLFLGGYKRPEITVPNIVLQLSPEEVLDDRSVLKVIDQAVVRRVGIVVLNGGVGSGGRLYEAACLLKSVIRDRAYLMIAERVDIAAAVNASGVVLSDQGLPAIVARNTMVGSRSDSVAHPLVARKVQTSDAALSASSSEGADFLIYEVNGETNAEEPVISILGDVTVPIFYTTASLGFDLSSRNLLFPFSYNFVKQLGEYVTWLQSSNARERRMYSESFDKRLASVNDFPRRDHLDAGELQIRRYELSLQVIENFSAAAASEVLEKEIRLAVSSKFA